MTWNGSGRRPEDDVPAENYIVRVYRRAGSDGKDLTGLVEQVDGNGRLAFRSRDELWAFLAEPYKRMTRQQKGKIRTR